MQNAMGSGITTASALKPTKKQIDVFFCGRLAAYVLLFKFCDERYVTLTRCSETQGTRRSVNCTQYARIRTPITPIAGLGVDVA